MGKSRSETSARLVFMSEDQYDTLMKVLDKGITERRFIYDNAPGEELRKDARMEIGHLEVIRKELKTCMKPWERECDCLYDSVVTSDLESEIVGNQLVEYGVSTCGICGRDYAMTRVTTLENVTEEDDD